MLNRLKLFCLNLYEFHFYINSYLFIPVVTISVWSWESKRVVKVHVHSCITRLYTGNYIWCFNSFLEPWHQNAASGVFFARSRNSIFATSGVLMSGFFEGLPLLLIETATFRHFWSGLTPRHHLENPYHFCHVHNTKQFKFVVWVKIISFIMNFLNRCTVFINHDWP